MHMLLYRNSAVLPLVSLLLLLLPAVVAAETGSSHHHHGTEDPSLDEDRPHALSDESVFQIEGTWTNQDGRPVSLSSFSGHPVVSTMLYSSCQYACPIILADLKRIESGLDAEQKKDVRFVLFSLDSHRDTPEKLREFAEKAKLDLSRWTLLHASESDIRTAAAVFGIRFKRDRSGEYAHSNVISILDRKGVIQEQIVGLKKDPSLALSALKSLSLSRPR